MKDQPRLLQRGGEDFTLAVLRSARLDVGSNAARTRTLAAVVASTSAITHIASAEAGWLGIKGGNLLLAKWLCAGFVAGAASMGGIVAIEPSGSPPVAAPAAPSPKLSGGRPTRTEAAIKPPTAKPESEPVEAPAMGSAAQRRAPAERAESALAAELGLLDRARHAIGRGNGGEALEALRMRDQEHRGGSLGPEAMVLRVEALLLVGRRSEAERLVDAWSNRHPTGAHTERMRRVLAKGAE